MIIIILDLSLILKKEIEIRLSKYQLEFIDFFFPIYPVISSFLIILAQKKTHKNHHQNLSFKLSSQRESGSRYSWRSSQSFLTLPCNQNGEIKWSKEL